MIIAIDLDGTLVAYTGYGDGTIQELLPGAVEFCKKLFEQGHELWVFTARASDPDGLKQTETMIKASPIANYISGITATKEYFFDVFVDDRGLRFEGNYDMIFDQLQRVQPWWKYKRKHLKFTKCECGGIFIPNTQNVSYPEVKCDVCGGTRRAWVLDI